MWILLFFTHILSFHVYLFRHIKYNYFISVSNNSNIRSLCGSFPPVVSAISYSWCLASLCKELCKLICELLLFPGSFFFFNLIEVQLLYNVISISAVQPSDSVIHIYTFFFCILSHYGLSHDIEYRFLCYTPCCLSILNVKFLGSYLWEFLCPIFYSLLPTN